MKATQLPVMGVSAQTTMNGAAKCDRHCALQDSMRQQKDGRILLFRAIPENVFASVSYVFPQGVYLAALVHVSWWFWTCATLNISFGRGVVCGRAALVRNIWNFKA